MKKTIGLILFLVCTFPTFAQYDADVEEYNYVLGTQTIGPLYKFSTDNKLVETAKAINALGSNILKISLDANSYGMAGGYTDLTSLVRDNVSFKYVIDMPFKNYFFWARSNADWADGYSESERTVDSIQLYNLTKYLLTKYNNTGKTFYLGHWEGDWNLLVNYDRTYVPSDERCQNMIKWYHTRQNAIDKAKSETEYSNVQVYHYAEVNQVVDAKTNGKKRVVNNVLPYINVDFVSYSCYDVQWLGQAKFNEMLDYIESKMAPKPGIVGKRVFIGEVGTCLEYSNWSIDLHESYNRVVFVNPMKWGCPFVLYWQMYNNETSATTGIQRGYWLINNLNEKQPLYNTFLYFYDAAKKWVSEYKRTNGTLPPQSEYLTWATTFLQIKPTALNNAYSTDLDLKIEASNQMLTLTNGDKKCDLKIYSVNGTMLKKTTLSQNETCETQFVQGVYIIETQTSIKGKSYKIVL